MNNPLLVLGGALAGVGVIWYLVRWLRLRASADMFVGKVVIITGASRGIGQVAAYAFARAGANLVLAARSRDDLNGVAEECRVLNPDVETLVIPTDVTDKSQLKKLLDRALERFGQIDVLVNNAGIRQGGGLAELSLEAVEKHLEANLLSAVRLTHMVLPHMLAQGSGYIVNMASAAGRHTEPYFVAYGTSKHGLVGFSAGLRRELTPAGIRTLTVNPGFTKTDMVSDIGPVYKRMGFAMIPPERIVRRMMAGIRLGKPEVHIGLLAAAGGILSTLLPRVSDLYWRVFMPRDFPEAAKRQFSD